MSRRLRWDQWLALALILISTLEAFIVLGVVAAFLGLVGTGFGRIVGWAGLNLALPLGILEAAVGVIVLAKGECFASARTIAPSAVIFGVLGVLIGLFLSLLSGRFGQVY